jgi:hypothetical protein
MNIEQARKHLIFEGVRGSTLFGTSTPSSDIDIHGIFILPKELEYTLNDRIETVSDEKGDMVFYELRKFMKLATTANPTILEALWADDMYASTLSPQFKMLQENRDIFLTSKTYYSFTGYAVAQMKKAKGANKKVHMIPRFVNEEGIAKLRELVKQGNVSVDWLKSRFNKNFAKYIMKPIEIDINVNVPIRSQDTYLTDPNINCMLLPKIQSYVYMISDSLYKRQVDNIISDATVERITFDGRANPYSNTGIVDVSKVEHVPYLYRAYKNGSGLFDGNNQVKCTSITKERELTDYIGLLFVNEQLYQKECSEYKSFWEWMGNRSESRYTNDNGVGFDYDRKNMQHLCRLVLSCENIFTNGAPIVTFTGDKLEFLRDVRAGKYSFQELTSFVDSKMEVLEDLYKNTTLPRECSLKRVNNLYKAIMEM